MTAIEAPHQSHVIKMDDRKRPSPYDQHDGPPSKKVATTGNGSTKSHPDADMPWKDDVEKFQKGAILRQMQEYRKEKQILDEQLRQAEKKALYHDDHLRIINVWFKEVIDEMKVMAGEVPTPISGKTMVPSVLYSAEIETFTPHLEKWSQEIKSTLEHVFSACQSYSPEVISLQTRLSEKLAAEKVHQVELERLQAEVEELSDRRDKAVERYMKAERKIERRLGKAANNSKTDEVFLGVARSASDATVKREDTVTNGANGADEALQDLEETHHKALAMSEKQKEQIEKLESANLKLTGQLTEAAAKSTHHSDDEYANTELFKLLKSQYDDVIKRVNHLEGLNIQLQEEAVKLRSERTAFKLQIENESKLVMADREAQLANSEGNLARIRSSRDELLADQAIKRSAYDQDRASMQKLRQINEASDQRIQALELQNERLRPQNPGEISEGGSQDSLSPQELQSRHQDLERKHNLLTSELSSMEKAFMTTKRLAGQKVSDLSSMEEKVQRLSAEKAKADQKYFAAMKSKETRDSEIRTLRLQNTKSSDVVSQLKSSEVASRALCTNLEKAISDIKDSLASVSAGHRNTTQQLTEAKIAGDGLKAQILQLNSLLVAKDEAAAKDAAAHRKAELTVAELEAAVVDTKKALENSRANLGGSSDVNDSFRALAICTVCKRNFKDTVIKTCGHVFCKECVDERLTSRSRKCPNCNKSFGSNDHMKITL